MRKVIVNDQAIHLEYTAYFHGFDSTEDSVYAIVEEDSTGVIRVVDVTAVRFLNDPNGKNITLKVSGGAFAVRLTDWLCSFWGIMADVKQEWFNRPKIDYETPDDIFEPLDLEFGFTLDVAAHEGNAKCKDFFTEDDNGLLQPWHGVCWMNPPFGRVMKKWVKKAFEEWKRGSTVVCLLPARTNTAWWHDWVMQGEIRFIRGEVTFKGQKNGLWMPMAIVVFRA